MKRAITRRLVFVGLPLILLGVPVLIVANVGVVQLQGLALVLTNILSGIVLGLGILAMVVGYIGAIVRAGQLQQWAWFGVLLGLLVFLWPIGIIALVIYCFLGPDTAVARTPVYIMYPPPPPPFPPTTESHRER